MENLIAYVLIELFHVQLQEPANKSTTTTAFMCNLSLNFIITKYLKQEVGDDLSICVNELSPYGLSVTEDIKIYSMSRDQMVMMLLPIMEKCPMDFYQEVVIATRYKEICQSHAILR